MPTIASALASSRDPSPDFRIKYNARNDLESRWSFHRSMTWYERQHFNCAFCISFDIKSTYTYVYTRVRSMAFCLPLINFNSMIKPQCMCKVCPFPPRPARFYKKVFFKKLCCLGQPRVDFVAHTLIWFAYLWQKLVSKRQTNPNKWSLYFSLKVSLREWKMSNYGGIIEY